MEALSIRAGEKPRAIDTYNDRTDGFVWLDFAREESPDWAIEAERFTGIRIHPSHVSDSKNVDHPSYFDKTQGYEMVVFRGLGVESDPDQLTTRQSTVFLTDDAIITIRPRSSVSTARLKDRLAGNGARVPNRPVGLMHLLFSTMVDRFMELREPLNLRIEEWQRRLLDPKDPFDDWMQLMEAKARLRRLEVLCEGQQDAILSWREDTTVDLDDHQLSVRINDLLEHVRRVQTQSQQLQSDLDNLVQINFSAVAHRANEIMKMLTVVAAIFLPLSLFAGIWGMNFDHMPELHFRNAYFWVLGGMITIAIVLLAAFKKRGWI